MDLSGATILLTGGTGSFGNAFARRVTRDWPDAVVRVYSRRAEAIGDAQPLRRRPTSLPDRRRPRSVPHDASRPGRRHRHPRRGHEAGAGVRVQPVRSRAHERAGRPARDRRRHRCGRPEGGGALHRQGREPGEPVRRHEAVRGEDRRAGQRVRVALRDATLVRPVRQRGRFARIGRPRLPPAGE